MEYALAYDLLLGNTCFKKHDSHFITYRSGNTATQIDCVNSEAPAQACLYGCEGDSLRGGCSAASAPGVICRLEFTPPSPHPLSNCVDHSFQGNFNAGAWKEHLGDSVIPTTYVLVEK